MERQGLRGAALVAAVSLLCSCALPKAEPMRLADTTGPTALKKVPHSLRLMSLNIAHGSGLAIHPIFVAQNDFRPNLDVVAKLLRRERPDMVALQESDTDSVWTGNFDHVLYLAKQAGFAHALHGIDVVVHFFGPKLQAGTTLLSRLVLRHTETVAFKTGHGDLQGFVIATVRLPDAPNVSIDIVSVHLHPGSAKGRLAQRKALARRLRERERDHPRPLIVMGDFNCPWSGDGGCVEPFAKELHLAAYEPEADMPTFSTTNPRWRIDWILISPQLEFVAYNHLADEVSDHRPVLATVALRP